MNIKLIIQIIAGVLLLLYLAYLWKRWSKKYSIRELTDATLDLGESHKVISSKTSDQCVGSSDASIQNSATCAMADCSVRSALRRIKSAPEYYDDEELDVLANRSPQEYTAHEIKLLEEVLDTLRTEDVAGWMRSLGQRHIALPEDLHRRAAARLAQE